ncbi:MAG: hypothetical protein K0R34_2165 [Herbinix sp.]|nr:hypothetical protein [Herbinix sp.]
MNVDEALKLLYKQDNIPKALSLYFPGLGLTITNSKIVSESMELTEQICSGDDLVFGSCEASQLKITVADIPEELKDQEFIITQNVGAYIMPLGTYKVESALKQNDKRFKDIIAYDRMRSIDIDVAAWYNALTFPLTLAAFRASLLAYLGLTEALRTLPNDNMMVEKTIEPTQIGGRVALQACEEINGAFGHIDRSGQFTHIILEPGYGLYPSETLYPAEDLYPVSETDTSYVQLDFITETIEKSMYRQDGVRFEEYTVKEIDKLQIRSEEDDIGAIVGIGTNAYVIEGNFLIFGKSAAELETIALNAYGNMAKRPYRPYQSENIGLPYVEVGDTIAISTDDVVTGYVFQRTMTGIQALKDYFVAEGSEKREQNFGLNKEIIQLQGRTALIKKTVDEVSVTLTDLAENTQSQFTQTTQQISAEVTRATQAEGTLSGSISVMADNILLKVDKNGIIGAINLTSEEATISAGKINFNGYATFNVDGLLTGIKGDVINTGTINAGLVNVINLNANNITAGTISGDRINGGTISGVTIQTTGSQYTTTITNGYIDTDFMSAEAINITEQMVVGSGISMTASTGVITATRINCNNINGYTPIHSGNIGSQNVSYASSSGSAGSADAAGYAEYAEISNNSTYLDGVVYISEYANLRPITAYAGVASCGTSLGKWSSVWANNGTIQTSDERLKINIKQLDEDTRFLSFAKMIVPYMYQMIEGTSGRYHIGFIAQRIEEAMAECGISDMEFAGLIKAPVYSEKLKDEDGNEIDEYDISSEIIDYSYNLRYDEFIPLIFLWLLSL